MGGLAIWLPARAEGANQLVPAFGHSGQVQFQRVALSPQPSICPASPTASQSLPRRLLPTCCRMARSNLANWTVGLGSPAGPPSRPPTPTAELTRRSFTNGSIRTTFATTPGQTYKVTGRAHIVSESSCPGCWGGMRFSAYDANWQEIGGSGVLLTATQGSGWFKIAFSFVATQTGTPWMSAISATAGAR